MNLLSEFKAFAVRGNVVDLAIAVVIGAAFGQIVNSLVRDIIMPPVGFLAGGIDFADLFITLSDGEYPSLAAATAAGAATINYGVFINAVLSFLIVAWALFLVVRLIMRLRREIEAAEKPPEAVPPAPPPREQVLLEEIRDLLKLQAERR